jgi:hypothetical protein|tara:strand:+ start:2300 stop:2656 length:357 start_codon:yes stop_codon:yes gene_type:complete
MVTTYIPKNKFFAPTRIHAIAKKIIADCSEDRARALETFGYFKQMVECNPEDDKAKDEMVKSLGLSQAANDKKVKVLDMMIKMTIQEEKVSPKTIKVDEAKLSFDDIKDAEVFTKKKQ